jgi:cell division protein FtsI (penicillin-binding protein 3)
MKFTANTRIGIACGIAASIFTVFSARLIHLHVAKHEEYSRLAAQKHLTRQVIHAKRGMILDRNGEILVTNLPVRTMFADSSRIKKPEALAALVATYLGLDETEVLEKFSTGKKYIVLKREVPEETALALLNEMQKQKLRGIFTEQDAVRIYPNGEVLGHVLGFLNHEGKAVQGIELSMNSQLEGKDGYRFIERDRTGREIVLYRGIEEEPEHGNNVRLTIDMGLQSIVEEELDAAYKDLKPETANAVLVDPKTGAILAMACRPCFNPNEPGKAQPDQMKNRAIIDMVEPGSTFKIVVAAGALNEGKVDEKTTIFCENGRFAYGGRILKDHHGYGHMGVHEILVKSSNIGSAKMALMMGGDKFYEYVRRFGFGERLGVELPGEIPGLVHPPARWDKLTITRMPMGHSIAVTPLQITMGMAVIANGGQLMAPRIVQSVEKETGEILVKKEPTIMRNVVPKKTAHFVSEALVGVTEPGGTAAFARVNGFQVAGKTGTAQKVSPHGGYAAGKYVVSFVGFMPAEDPKFVLLVMVDDAKIASNLNYGGLVAAPIFSRIAERAARYMDLTPTMPPIPLQPAPIASTPTTEKRSN